MIKAREWPMRAMYILIAAALALSLFITAAPAHQVSAADQVKAEWTKVSTPTMEDWVLAPNSTIIDYALASDGEVAYAIVDGYNAKADEYGYWLLKSDDSAATWTDITDKLEKVRKTATITELVLVATDWEDPDFVAVALSLNVSSYVYVFFSTDGGDTFNDAGEVEDGGVYLNYVSDLAVSPEAGGKRDIAIGGAANTSPSAGLFRCTVTGDNAGAWVDATAYPGWDNSAAFNSTLVTDIIFSPNWATDKTILVTTVTGTGPYTVHLQSGSWGTTAGWNAKSTLGISAVLILGGVNLPMPFVGWDARGIAGITVPSNYNSKSTDTRVLWVWVNYYDGNYPASEIVRVDNDSADPVVQQIKNGEVWLTNVSYYGTIAEGEAIAGLIGTGTYTRSMSELIATGCAGVQVYRNTGIHNMDICCERWKKACKPPTGTTAMAVSFVSEDKAYAVALQGTSPNGQWSDYDEGAWSVTFDSGDTWNQLSLIDTSIDYLSDVAVSPDCNKMMLVSVNGYWEENDGYTWLEHGNGCDSVWLKAGTLPEAQEYNGKWLRTWCGQLAGANSRWFGAHPERGLLRLPADETAGDTVFLVDRMTGTVLQNDLETLGCWTSISSTTVDEIVDLVAKDATTLYALDYNGDVSLYDSEGWHDAVESKVDEGWSIAARNSDILVGGYDGEVSYSDDGGETFTALEEVPSIDGLVSVAFDSYFSQNSIVYAATADITQQHEWFGGGIYRWVIDESDKWEDMGANNYAYTGIVLGRNPGNPKTSADTGGVLYASYTGEWCNNYTYEDYPDSDNCWKNEENCWYTGVARSLNPAKTIQCLSCVEWDYLTVGLTEDETFIMGPQALKICGCMDPSTDTKLFAIGQASDGYDMAKAEYGTVWTFEDCYAKKAPEITSPTGNTTIPADPCSCYNAPFTINWDPLCDACHYEIQFALDEDFNTATGSISVPPEGSRSITSFLVPGGEGASLLSCETTYYLRVRAYQAGTCQVIRSWWSDPLKITIAPSVQQAVITLVSPVPGALNVPPKSVGFSWNTLAAANKFDWVLSKNADLSSPVESKTGLTGKAYTCNKTLDYGTTYYWQVKAYNDGVVVSTSAIGTFTTAATGAFCCPQCGLCFDTQELLKAHIAAEHPAQPATPFWVWVIIAIGAVLVIVVIVLIFRTRRV
jgi:hypothetical protein